MMDKNTKTGCMLCSVLLICFVVGCPVLLKSKIHDTPPKTGPADYEIRAAAQTFIERQLKSPGSASHSWTAEIKPLAPNSWTVTSYVDSQNSFGALLRTNYSMDVTYTGDAWKAANLKTW